MLFDALMRADSMVEVHMLNQDPAELPLPQDDDGIQSFVIKEIVSPLKACELAIGICVASTP